MHEMINILMVDDEEDAASLFRQKFRKEVKDGRINLKTASSGAEALEMLKEIHQAHPLLILSDINMPGMDGLTLLNEIRRLYPDLMVFMVSAYSNNTAFLHQAKVGGASDFIPKPIDFYGLKEKIFSMV